jgi:hypothetical protein
MGGQTLIFNAETGLTGNSAIPFSNLWSHWQILTMCPKLGVEHANGIQTKMGRSKTENGERAAGLVNSELFGAVNREALRSLQDSAQSVVLEKGQTLFLQGDVADAIYIVEEGSIEVSILGETGKKLTLNVMRSNDVFGEIAALDGGVRTASAAAVSPSKLRKISRQAIFQVMQDHPDLAIENHSPALRPNSLDFAAGRRSGDGEHGKEAGPETDRPEQEVCDGRRDASDVPSRTCRLSGRDAGIRQQDTPALDQ